ncbi:MAG: hypothetical protein AAFZ11_01110 [Pseudomonadota bacterium]
MQSPASFTTGANGLYAGHSFYVPVAQAFNVSVQRAVFEDHAFDAVFAAGGAGTAQSLWENEARRAEIEARLATGQVDLFGITVSQENEADPLEFYELWIDLARQYNPDTAILIGFPYTLGGAVRDTQTYAEEIASNSESTFAIIEDLREAYPDTSIFYFNYGLALSEMKEDFEAGELEDIVGLVAPSPAQLEGYLFVDGGPSHAGPMAEHVCSLVWAHYLYGADIEELVDPIYKREDVLRVAREVIEFNVRFLPVEGG